LDAFFGEALDAGPVNIALLGCGCSIATKAVAEVVHYWKLSQISFASPSADLKDRERFRTHFQMYPPDDTVAPSIVTLVDYYGWTRMSIITEKQNTYLKLETEVKMGLMERNISLINPVQFEADENLDERDDLFVSCSSQTIEGFAMHPHCGH